jgi:hypothetical protein
MNIKFPTKISMKEKREMVARLLQDGDKGAVRLGYNAAYAFKKGPKTAAKHMRKLIPVEHFPIVLATMVRQLHREIGVVPFFKCFPEHEELLRGIVVCCVMGAK